MKENKKKTRSNDKENKEEREPVTKHLTQLDVK